MDNLIFFFPRKFGRDDIGERLHVSAQFVTGNCCSHPVASPNIGVRDALEEYKYCCHVF